MYYFNIKTTYFLSTVSAGAGVCISNIKVNLEEPVRIHVHTYILGVKKPKNWYHSTRVFWQKAKNSNLFSKSSLIFQ